MRAVPEAQRILDLSDVTPEKMEVFRRYLQKYRVLCCCGLPATGKSTLVEALLADHVRATHWQRNVVYRMLFGTHTVDHSVTPSLKAFEKSALTRLLDTSDAPLVFEGWLLTRRGRGDVLKLTKGWPRAILVFDGPDSGIISRIRNTPDSVTWPVEETGFQLGLLRGTFEPPCTSDGWGEVIYINTFGAAGLEYYQGLFGEVDG